MNSDSLPPLLAADEPDPVSAHNAQGRSPLLIVVDHAARRIPRKLQGLGLPESELQRHIAWDIGALAVGRKLADRLDAALIAQNYSRLVIDCNRDPAVESAIPSRSTYASPGSSGSVAAYASAPSIAPEYAYTACNPPTMSTTADPSRV